MVTKSECKHYDNCGFVKFRKERPWHLTPILPKSGDCGIDFAQCQRANPAIKLVEITDPLPATQEEINIAYPVIYVNKDGQERRVFGGHQ